MARKGLKPGDSLPVDDPDMPAIRTVRASVVVSGMGPLSTPAYPRIPGLETFKGKAFHSQQWDHAYDLRGKRVAVIGTGASAIQFVPRIQPDVLHLDVYQRTPPWVLPKSDHAIAPAVRRLYRAMPIARMLRRLMIYLGLESRAIALAFMPTLVWLAEVYARHYLRTQVADPTLRRKLTPSYSLGCKRVLLTNDWLSALTRPNVDVVTTGIAEVREGSIVDTEGVERPVDTLIYGTGFRIQELIARGLVFGRGGVDLVDTWRRGPEAYKGTTFAGFPNLFWLTGPNTGLGHNSIVYMIESQTRYVIDALRTMRRDDLAEIEVERRSQDEFNERLERRAAGTVWTEGGCRSYYLNPETGRNYAIWPGFTFTFRWATRAFDAANYRVRRRAQAPLEDHAVGLVRDASA
jgi:cyclohexanone monooxygenase